MDKSLLRLVNDQKVSKNEMLLVDQKIENLNDKLKHLSVIFAEMSKTLIPYRTQTYKFLDEADKTRMGAQIE